MDTFENEGATLEFHAQGTGPPLVLVHGSVFADPWGSVLHHGNLLGSHRILTPHRRGYRGSSPARPERTVADEGADLVALLDHLEIPRAHVVGHSLAADIVLQAVIDAPERFSTMTLLEPGLFTVPAAAGLSAALGAVRQIFESGDHRQAMLLFLGGPAGEDLTAQLLEELPADAAENAVADTPGLFEGDLPAGSTWTLDEAAARSLPHPTLLMLGSETSPVYRETHALVAELIPGVEPLEVAGAGHFMHLERPRVVAEALAAFLDRHER